MVKLEVGSKVKHKTCDPHEIGLVAEVRDGNYYQIKWPEDSDCVYSTDHIDDLVPVYSSCEAAQVDVQHEEYGPIRTRSQIIALSGPAGSGKSTAAAYLVERHGFTLVKFATPLKNMLRAIGLTEREIEGSLKQEPSGILCGRTPRYAMQTLGTEWGRNIIGDTFWTDLWSREAARYDRVVCDDCRFENEASVVRNMGGIIVGLTGRGGIEGSHVSENGVTPDMTVDNSGDVLNMNKVLDRLVTGV